MNWFFIALLATLCFSTITHIDKYLISRYLNSAGIGALMLFSSFFSIITLPIIFFIEKKIFSISPLNAIFLIGVGILSFVAIFFYLKALVYAEASVISPFFQLIPVFGFILGFIFLGELIPIKSIIAGLIIMTGISILSFEKKDNLSIRFNKKVVLLMIGSSFVYALYEVFFKVIAIKETFWVSLFWQNIGLLITGIFLYFFIPLYREDFHSLIKNNGFNIINLNLINESLNTVAVVLIQYASLLAPIVLIFLVNSMQPLMVFLIGILLTLFIPKISQEDLRKKIILQKSIAIFIVLLGSYFLYF